VVGMVVHGGEDTEREDGDAEGERDPLPSVRVGDGVLDRMIGGGIVP